MMIHPKKLLLYRVLATFEVEILFSIKKQWGNQPLLQLWNVTTSHCTWPGIRCSGVGTTVTGISLRSQSMTGQIPPSICELKSLTTLDLGDNAIGGGFPAVLYNCSNLQIIDLSHNLFAGKLPNDINNLSLNLKHLNLDTNYFSGEVPQGLWTLGQISTLVLSNNYLSGQVPGQLGSTLTQLKINNNKFSGEIPPTVGTSWANLEVIEASNNSLSGSIPFGLTNLSRLRTLNLDGNSLSGELPWRIISWKKLDTLKLSKNQISGSIPAALASLPALNFLDLSYNQLSGQIPPQLGLVYQFSLNLSSNKLTGQIPYGFDQAAYRNSFLGTSLCSESETTGLPPCSIHRKNARALPLKYLVLAIVAGVVATLANVYFSWSMILGLRKARYFKATRLQDLKSYELTSFQRLDFTKRKILGNLTETNPIGFGGSAKVYKIPVNESGGVVAVKIIKNMEMRYDKQFQAEVQILSKIRHRNVVKLLCCISSHDSKILVYEYMEKQSLDKWIHKRKQRPFSTTGPRSVEPAVLDWPTRLRVAFGAAQGLYYMHHESSPPIIHRDVKSSNILLDSKFNAKIGDFGLAKLFTKTGQEPQTVSAVVGTAGYVDPEYLNKIKVSTSSDVYSFGVVLLELVTGRAAQHGGEYSNLAQWAWTHHFQEHPVADVFDEEVKEDRFLEEMGHVFKLALVCTNTLPSSRPSMKEVLRLLRAILEHDEITLMAIYQYHSVPFHGENSNKAISKEDEIVEEDAYYQHDFPPARGARTCISTCDHNSWVAYTDQEIVEEDPLLHPKEN